MSNQDTTDAPILSRRRYRLTDPPARTSYEDEGLVERVARQWCEDHSHSLRSRGKAPVADRDCLHQANMAQYRAVELCAARHGRGNDPRDYCEGCLRDALAERLATPRGELPPLPSSVRDREAIYLDELLRSGGRWKLSGLLAMVNARRHAEGKDPYTETACSARIRDLRKAGRHIEQAGEAGGAEYWMPEVTDQGAREPLARRAIE